MAVAGAFTQANTSTNNFSVIPQKIAKVNSLASASQKIAFPTRSREGEKVTGSGFHY
ncbi:hypothetical protein VB740_32130 [Nostoc sp. UHCC 0251]|nr:hypothetical protein [Nostoc sp. UHCC 0251]